MVSQLSELRASAVADASEAGSVSSVARRFGVSRQRAYQLLRQARGPEPTAGDKTRKRVARKDKGNDDQ